MNPTLLPVALSLLSLVAALDMAEVDTGIDPSTLFCHQPLLQHYGFIGTPVPVDVKLPMCPNVLKSCCLFSDQITIYEQWVHREELKKLEARFAYHQSIYGAVIDTAVQVQDNANSVLKKLKSQRISNCKILAKRIIHFEFKDLALRLKNALAEMHTFFRETYSGFYCALCDATNHRFVRNDTAQLVLSRKFCRRAIESSLHVLLYFHSHMLKYTNLLLKFSTFCDSNGFFALKPISSDDLFEVVGTDRKSLERCRDFRNSPSWFEECGHVCGKFGVNSYDYFFEPHLKQFRKAGKILADAIAQFEKPDAGTPEETLDKEKLAGIPEIPGGRKLAEHPGNPGEITALDVASTANPFPSQKVILADDDSVWALDKYDLVFEEDGLNLHQVGITTEITKTQFDLVEAEMIRMGKLKKSAGLPSLLALLLSLLPLLRP